MNTASELVLRVLGALEGMVKSEALRLETRVRRPSNTPVKDLPDLLTLVEHGLEPDDALLAAVKALFNTRRRIRCRTLFRSRP